MLEAESEEGWEGGEEFQTSSKDSALSRQQLKELKFAKKLTSGEVVSQSFLFLLAGFETTSSALVFVTYLLATHPEVQDKLYSEIMGHFENEEQINYESVTKLSYLDLVLKESLRLYPNASAVAARESSNACHIGNTFIPGGLAVAADVWTVHYSKELWGDDADEFRPERFSHEESRGRHHVAWMPFGLGPRNCIGMRFALFEEKLTLTRMLMRFRIVKCSQTEERLELIGNQTLGPKHVTIMLKKRIE